MRKKVTKKVVIPKISFDDIVSFIEECVEEGQTKPIILAELMENFKIGYDEALDYYNGYLTSSF